MDRAYHRGTNGTDRQAAGRCVPHPADFRSGPAFPGHGLLAVGRRSRAQSHRPGRRAEIADQGASLHPGRRAGAADAGHRRDRLPLPAGRVVGRALVRGATRRNPPPTDRLPGPLRRWHRSTAAARAQDLQGASRSTARRCCRCPAKGHRPARRRPGTALHRRADRAAGHLPVHAARQAPVDLLPRRHSDSASLQGCRPGAPRWSRRPGPRHSHRPPVSAHRRNSTGRARCQAPHHHESAWAIPCFDGAGLCPDQRPGGAAGLQGGSHTRCHIAGPAADELKSGALPEEAVDWLKTNFFKTELELGHCLRLPQEGPCECDLYLTCAKFVTTPAYAPRLRARRRVEQALATDAAGRGWDREVERHGCTAKRIEKLLTDLEQPLESPDDTLAWHMPTVSSAQPDPAQMISDDGSSAVVEDNRPRHKTAPHEWDSHTEVEITAAIVDRLTFAGNIIETGT